MGPSKFFRRKFENMSVLSIIACEMLEDELVYILSNDSEIKQLIVVENKNNLKLLRKLKSKNCTPRIVFMDRVPMLLEDVDSLN